MPFYQSFMRSVFSFNTVLLLWMNLGKYFVLTKIIRIKQVQFGVQINRRLPIKYTTNRQLNAFYQREIN